MSLHCKDLSFPSGREFGMRPVSSTAGAVLSCSTDVGGLQGLRSVSACRARPSPCLSSPVRGRNQKSRNTPARRAGVEPRRSPISEEGDMKNRVFVALLLAAVLAIRSRTIPVLKANRQPLNPSRPQPSLRTRLSRNRRHLRKGRSPLRPHRRACSPQPSRLVRRPLPLTRAPRRPVRPASHSSRQLVKASGDV